MKYFKCGSCQTPFKLEEKAVKATQAIHICSKCGARNVLRFGPHLVVQQKDGPIRQYPLKLGSNHIGREANPSGNSVTIDDKYLSRSHAEVLLKEQNDKLFFYIRDLGSTNGTYSKEKVKLPHNTYVPFLETDYFIAGLTRLSIKYNL